MSCWGVGSEQDGMAAGLHLLLTQSCSSSAQTLSGPGAAVSGDPCRGSASLSGFRAQRPSPHCGATPPPAPELCQCCGRGAQGNVTLLLMVFNTCPLSPACSLDPRPWTCCQSIAVLGDQGLPAVGDPDQHGEPALSCISQRTLVLLPGEGVLWVLLQACVPRGVEAGEEGDSCGVARLSPQDSRGFAQQLGAGKRFPGPQGLGCSAEEGSGLQSVVMLLRAQVLWDGQLEGTGRRCQEEAERQQGHMSRLGAARRVGEAAGRCDEDTGHGLTPFRGTEGCKEFSDPCCLVNRLNLDSVNCVFQFGNATPCF
ncbi:hypothetical protein CB1_000218006 [Camelus ferus]|nr:hypothetical protein CB1_000218006 [Camelus ferus]